LLAVAVTVIFMGGGPSVYPPTAAAVLGHPAAPGQDGATAAPRDAARRSVYVHVKRSLLVPILATHDAADTDSSCPVRYATTVPTQALGLLNGAFTNEQAACFAGRLLQEAPGDVASQVRRAIRLTTAHEPAGDEVRDDVAFLERLTVQSHLDARAALTQYCLMTLNANAFLYLD